MALPNDPSGIPPRPDPPHSGGPDELFANEEVWSGSADSADAPREKFRVEPIGPLPGATSFESNPRSTIKATPEGVVPAPAPGPGKSSASRRSTDMPRQDEDVFQTGELLPETPPPTRESGFAARNEAEPSAGEDTADSPPEEANPPDDKKPALTTPGGKMGLVAAVVAILALVGSYAAALHASRPNTTDSAADVVPDVPMRGEIATVSKVESGWRARRPSDRVSTIDTILPDISRAEPTLLPEVKFSIDPAKSKEGFLRFIFLDPAGQISGDVLVVKVSQGKLESAGSSAEVISPTDGAVYCSFGFLDTPSFIAYATDEGPRWNVEISESADYNSGESGWKRLGFFEVASRR